MPRVSPGGSRPSSSSRSSRSKGSGTLAALQRSTALFREKWGEQLAGTASIGLLFALLGIVPALTLGGLGIASGSNEVLAVVLVVAVAIMIVAAVLGSAARAVFSVALYRYASSATGTGLVHTR